MEGPSKAEISCTDNQDGTCSVSYLPVLPGDYSIVVKYNDKHIPGSPFTARITGTGWGAPPGAVGGPGGSLQRIQSPQGARGRPEGIFGVPSPLTPVPAGDDSLRLSHLKVGASADIPLDIGETDLSQLTATVTAPSGRKEPCQLKRLRNGHIGEGGDTRSGRDGGPWGRRHIAFMGRGARPAPTPLQPREGMWGRHSEGGRRALGTQGHGHRDLAVGV